MRPDRQKRHWASSAATIKLTHYRNSPLSSAWITHRSVSAASASPSTLSACRENNIVLIKNPVPGQQTEKNRDRAFLVIVGREQAAFAE
jgi:hypothetical protein